MPTAGHVLSAHAHNWLVWVGKGRQQILDVLLQLSDANAARGVCALESSSYISLSGEVKRVKSLSSEVVL